MGAIAGVVYPDVFRVGELIGPMLEVLEHRSREEPNIHRWNTVQIGGRTAAIERNFSRSIIAFVDGEIWNLPELHKALSERGSTRRPVATTGEAVVQAYEVWGPDFLRHLQGEFGLVLLDEEKKQIILARDRMGIKPLYWTQTSGHFFFASDIKALLATGLVPKSEAPEAIAGYLTLGHFPLDISPIVGVNKLLPGHYLVYPLDGSVNLHSYWSMANVLEEGLARKEPVSMKRMQVALGRVIKQRLPEKGQIGCIFSSERGPLSVANAVVKLAAPRKVMGFARENGIPGEEQELSVRRMGKKLGLLTDTVRVEAYDFVRDGVKMIWHLGEPLADPWAISTWELGKHAAGQVDRLLGSAAIEGWLTPTSALKEEIQKSSWAWRHLGVPITQEILEWFRPILLTRMGWKMWRSVRISERQSSYLNAAALFPPHLLHKVSPEIGHLFDADIFLQHFSGISSVPTVQMSHLYIDMKTRMPESMMLQHDRLFSAQGVRWSAPLLDPLAMEYFAVILGDATSPLENLMPFLTRGLPADVLRASEMPHPKLPLSWCTSDLFTDIWRLLPHGIVVDSGIIEGDWLRNVLKTPTSRKTHFLSWWSVLALEIWMRLFIQRPYRPNPPELTVTELLSE